MTLIIFYLICILIAFWLNVKLIRRTSDECIRRRDALLMGLFSLLGPLMVIVLILMHGWVSLDQSCWWDKCLWGDEEEDEEDV